MTVRLAAPALFLASLLLLPFLNRPLAIDDPLFLREARHALVDPLHPADFEQVWNAGDRQKLSQYLLGGTLPAYVLAPVAALGGREWMAHLYQLMLFSGFVIASVSVARRLGCDPRQANVVGLLVATNPVSLAMAATCMPDVMAAMFAMAGLDRLLLFREERRWGAGLAAGLAAGLLLAAAVLCRASTAPLVLVAALLVMPAAWKRAAHYLWPLAVAAVAIAVFAGLNRGGAAHASVGAAFQALTAARNVPRNLVAFLCFQALTGPILVYALLSRGAKFAGAVAALVALGVALSRVTASANLVLYAVPAALGICLVWAAVGVVRGIRHAAPSAAVPPGGSATAAEGRRFAIVWPLVVWLGAGLVALPYVHMAAKYLLPGVPAAALLVAFHAARAGQRRYPLTVALLIALGWSTGALIVIGDTTLANSQRQAVDRLIAPRVRRGLHVWAAGQWTFLAYAEDAGAHALANTPPLPGPGDYLVVSRLGYYGKLDRLPFRRELLNTAPDRRCGVFVLNRHLGAGFYSIRFGYLPFAIGCAEVDAYDLYRVLP